MRELTLPAPLVLLPGLAADARLFTRQRRALGPNLITPEWPALPPDPDRRETLRSFATVSYTHLTLPTIYSV